MIEEPRSDVDELQRELQRHKAEELADEHITLPERSISRRRCSARSRSASPSARRRSATTWRTQPKQSPLKASDSREVAMA